MQAHCIVQFTTLIFAVGAAALAPAARAEIPNGGQSGDFQVVQERGGLPNVFSRLRAHKPVSIVYFGGSITEGAGASRADETSYRGRVGQWFKTTFPESQITNVNAAIGGTGSDLGAFRLPHDVLPSKPDLVFVEFAVNDGGAAPAMIDRSMEGIVRQIWRANPSADICFIYTFVVGQLPQFKAHQLTPAVARDERIADYYHISAVNVAIPAAERLLEGTITSAEFSKDGVHPTDAGYEIYASAITGFLAAQAEKSARTTRHRLPAPLRKDSLEHTRMISAQEITPLGTGWHVDVKSPIGRFPSVLVSSEPGSEQSAHFTGSTLALFYVLGPDTGAFDYRIDDAPWQTRDPFDVFAKGYYRPSYSILADGLPNTAHTLTIRIRAEHNPDSKGNSTRIAYVLTNE